MHSFIEVQKNKMLKRRGNFPYDFDAFYPAYPTPVMPPNYVHNPAPPPAITPPVPSAAPDASSAPVPSEAEGHPSPPAPESPEIKTEAPKAPSRKPPRRSHHFKPRPRRKSAHTISDEGYGVPSAAEGPASSHHSGKCSICHHPDRRAIEVDFIHWVRPSSIAWEFDISASAICRHARANRLYDLRAEKYIEALDLVVENAQGATVNGDMIIRAIRTATHFRASGQWVEPPKRVIYSIDRDPASAIAPPAPATAFASSSNDSILELAPPVTSEAREIDSQNHFDHDASH